MKKLSIVFMCLAIIFSLVACSNNVEFTEIENKTIVATDGTEYTFVGNEGRVWCFGEWEFIGHVKGEKKTFVHLTDKIKTGMYSVNDSQDVLVRYFPDNEFSAVYVKSELLKTEVSPDNCIRFEFVKGSLFNDKITTISNKGITECEQFLNEIKTILGCFQGSEVAGKIQHGSAWWFNDTKSGMESQLKSLANLSLLGNFIGMLTDSRSFLSYTRHEYFRRILCNVIGEWVENGEYPNDEKTLGKIVQDICYNNAERYFNI